MIHYSCPNCLGNLEAEEAAAGVKHACPNCGHQLQVPIPPVEDTPASRSPSSPAEPRDVVPLVVPDVPSKRIAVGVCAILLGWLGVHHFMLGQVVLGLPNLLLGILGIVVLILASLTGCPGLICLFLPLLVFTWGQSIYTGVCYLLMSDPQFAVLASRQEDKRRVPTLWIATIVYAGFLVVGLVLIVILVWQRIRA